MRFPSASFWLSAPYIASGKKTRKLARSTHDENVFSITLEEALQLLAQEVPAKGGKGRSKSAALVKEIGSWEGETIALADGRYGLYLKVGKKNVGLPAEYKSNLEAAKALTLDEAIAIIQAKAEK